jgi:hypothetical protein
MIDLDCFCSVHRSARVAAAGSMFNARTRLRAGAASLLVALAASIASAQQPAPAAPPAPPPYSLPWQLRPAVVANVVRSDTSIALYENPVSGNTGTTVASMLLGSYKLTPEFAPLIRLGVVSNSPPDGTTAMPAVDSAFGFVNPVLGGTYAIKLGTDFKLAFFLGVTIPVGMGGGDKPDPASKAARAAGIPARSAMDNAMFAVDDFTVFPGVDFAYVAGGFTAQAEATLLQLTRVRGDTAPAAGMPASNPDASKTNLTMGLNVGYFFIPQLSAGAELRHQRWLSTPLGVKKDEALPDAMQLGTRDTSTFAIGLRYHAKLSETMWLRPGVSLSMPIDDPMSKSKYKIIQLDIPFAF